MSAKQAAIAIANKTARTAWAIMVHGGVYEAGYRAPNIERRRARLPDKAWRWGDRRSGRRTIATLKREEHAVSDCL